MGRARHSVRADSDLPGGTASTKSVPINRVAADVGPLHLDLNWRTSQRRRFPNERLAAFYRDAATNESGAPSWPQHRTGPRLCAPPPAPAAPAAPPPKKKI